MSRLLPPLRPIGSRRAGDVLVISHGGRAMAADQPDVKLYSSQGLMRLGARGVHLVEVDLHATRDDHVIVHHGRRQMVDGHPVKIARQKASDVLGVASGDRAVLASDVLRAIRRTNMGVYLDVKDFSKVAASRLVRLLHSEDLTKRCILASADPGMVKTFAEFDNELPRAVLFRSTTEDAVKLARAACADFIHPCWEACPHPDRFLTRDWIECVRNEGLGVICWHEERPRVIAALLKLGIDGICSDEPQIIARLSARSSQGFE